MRTIVLLLASNVFMTFAWYYHLQQNGWSLWKAIAISWLIAFLSIASWFQPIDSVSLEVSMGTS